VEKMIMTVQKTQREIREGSPARRRKKVSVPPRSRSAQLRLFDEFFSGPLDKVQQGEHPYTNSCQLYDLAPKYVSTEDIKSRTRAMADGSRYLKSIKRTFGVGEQDYRVEVHPARFQDDAGIEFEVLPGRREELVEKAIRRIAIQGCRTQERQVNMHDDEPRRTVGVWVSLYEIRKELEKFGHYYKIDDIRAAIQTCARSTLVIAPVDTKAPQIESRLFEFVAFGHEGADGDRRTWISFNTLVAADIEALRYRQLNYGTNMGLHSAPARWLHEKLCHSWTWASLPGQPFEILATTIIRECGLINYSQQREAFRRLEHCIRELVDAGTLSHVQVEEHRGPRRKLLDLKFQLYPTTEFVREMKAANWRNKQLASKFSLLKAEEKSLGRL
jgi:hypothetical protein